MKSVKFFSFLMSCGIFLAAPSFAMDNDKDQNNKGQLVAMKMDNNNNGQNNNKDQSVTMNKDNQNDEMLQKARELELALNTRCHCCGRHKPKPRFKCICF